MYSKKKGPFLFKGKKNDIGSNKDDKFNFVNCSVGGYYCKRNILPEINRYYKESNVYRINKEYQKSIEFLQKAFLITQELRESCCAECVIFFQNNITETLENIRDELNEMSTGFFSTRRYKNIYIKLGDILMKLDIIGNNDSYLTSSGKITD